MPETNRSLKVFLCHAHSDKGTVKALYDRLVKDGVDAWLDKEKLLPGQSWRAEIQKAVRGADVVIVCHSKEFNQAGFRQREVKWALDTAMEKPEGEIFVIPARLEECDVLDNLNEWQWVDLFEDNGYDFLMKALKIQAESIGATLQVRRSWLSKKTAPVTKDEKPQVEEAPVVLEEKKPKDTKKQDAPIENDRTRSQEFLKSQKAHFKLKTGYIFAIFGTLVIIVTAIVGLPRIKKLFAQSPVSAGTATEQIQVSPIRQSTSIEVTKTIVPTPALTKTVTPTTRPLLTEVTDAKGVEMVLVPEGEFTMGSDGGEADEQPVHRVYLDAYYVDKYEVTNSLYKICVDARVCEQPNDTEEFNDTQYAKYPVVFINWYKANTYCEWRDARLPTEAEWEKAARGIDERTYPWGDEINGTYATYDRYQISRTTLVGSKTKGVSPYGIFDMAGNVWEWVADWYDEKYYNNSPYTNPSGPTSGNFRVLRGGSWYFSAYDIRTTNRFKYGPMSTGMDVGFRCVRSPDADTSTFSFTGISTLPP